MKLLRISLVSLFLLFFSTLTVFSANITSHKGTVPNGYNFWLSTPDNTKDAKPVIIFLHGKSLCGSDLNQVKRYGTIDAVEKGRNLDAYVIAPQNPGGAWKPEKVMNVLNWVRQNYKVDNNRIYVLGMSLGGHGTLDFTAAYPDQVAAAMALCGGGIRGDVSPLNEVPLWIVHGTADNAVSIGSSDKLVESMKKAGTWKNRLHYDRVAGMNHSRPARFFYLPETYEWLMGHNLSEKGRTIHKTFAVTDNLLSNAYAGLNFSKGGYKASKSYASNSKKSSKKASSKSYKNKKSGKQYAKASASKNSSVKRTSFNAKRKSHSAKKKK